MQQLHNFIYFGTPTVASDTLATLIENGLIPTVVVTSPDAPRGRGLVLTPSPTKSFALAHGIKVLTPLSLDVEFVHELKTYECDYAICVAYGKIFPEELIVAFPLGVLNVHYSLLPKYRGATPLEAALLAGDTETGVTIQRMVKALDAGDVIAQASTPIAPCETARELRPRLIAIGATLLADTLPAYLSGEIEPIVQDASQATHSHKLSKEDGLLTLPAGRQGSPQQDLENWNKYRAYADTIGTYFMKDGKRMKITSAAFKNGKFSIERVIPEGKRETNY